MTNELFNIINSYRDWQAFLLAAANGMIDGVTAFEQFARNPTTNTGDDIWAVDGVWTEVTTAAKCSIVSSSANDTANGTGARTFTVYGLDANYNQISETVSLNGLTPVLTVNNYKVIHRGQATTFGSGGTQAGDISGPSQDSGTPAMFKALAYGNSTNLGFYIVPANHTLFIENIEVAFQSSSANGTADIVMRAKPFGGGYILRANFPLSMGNANPPVRHYNYSLWFPEKTVIEFACTVASHAADVTVWGNGLLIRTS